MCPVFIFPDQSTGSPTDVMTTCILLHTPLALSTVIREQLCLLGSLYISSDSRRWVHWENLGPFMLSFGTCRKLLVDKEVQSIRCDCGPSHCNQPRECARIQERKHKRTHFRLFKGTFCFELYRRGSGSSNKRTSYAPDVPSWASQVQAERIRIFSSLSLSLFHLHIPLLSEQYGTLKERANWCGTGRWASKEKSWTFSVTGYFLWDSCDQNLSQAWLMFTR